MTSHPSTTLPPMEGCAASGLWTYEMVEARLVEAMELWRRSPGGGRWPFASDAPWHLMRRFNEAGQGFEFHDARGGDMKSSDVPLRPLPLSIEEVAERDAVSEWVPRYVPERDRRLVSVVLVIKASGARVSWLRLRRRFGQEIGGHGLRKRYARAINCICIALNAAEMRGENASRVRM